MRATVPAFIHSQPASAPALRRQTLGSYILAAAGRAAGAGGGWIAQFKLCAHFLPNKSHIYQITNYD